MSPLKMKVTIQNAVLSLDILAMFIAKQLFAVTKKAHRLVVSVLVFVLFSFGSVWFQIQD